MPVSIKKTGINNKKTIIYSCGLLLLSGRGINAFRLNLNLPVLGSNPTSFTLTISPSLNNPSIDSKRLQLISLICNKPCLPGMNSIKAPNS